MYFVNVLRRYDTVGIIYGHVGTVVSSAQCIATPVRERVFVCPSIKSRTLSILVEPSTIEIAMSAMHQQSMMIIDDAGTVLMADGGCYSIHQEDCSLET